ncbi:fumarylacetoacetate hydrolase family protein [Microbacterium sp. NPDC091313]
MPYVSALIDGEARIARLEADGTYTPLSGPSELGPATDVDTLASLQPAGPGVAASEVTLRPLVPRAGKILCVGLNYHDHVTETKRELPTYPVLFPKYASNLIAPDGAIAKPAETAQLDYEAELAVVIGRTGRRISEADAPAHVLGYATANDVTVRDFQYKTHQWLQGKAWDDTTPLGALSTPDEVDVSDARITLTLNGETLQDASTADLIFSIPFLIATVSQFTQLNPGDILLTGTPGGVGFRRDPQVFLQPGDEVTVEIGGLGAITNRVVAED